MTRKMKTSALEELHAMAAKSEGRLFGWFKTRDEARMVLAEYLAMREGGDCRLSWPAFFDWFAEKFDYPASRDALWQWAGSHKRALLQEAANGKS